MRKRIKLSALVMAGIMCFGVGMSSLAGTNAACTHTNMVQIGQTVSRWTVTHTVTLSESQGPQKCTGVEWVDEVYLHCTNCGHNVFLDRYNHAKHDVCGIDY